MAAYTTTQAGNWSDPATWGGSGPPGAGDTATINHAVTVDANTIVGDGTASIAINAALTIAAGVSLTLKGNVIQGNASFTMSAGASLVFDTTAANVKWLFGDVADFTTYANCGFVANGTSGARCSVSKVGGNYAWFDDFSENSGAGAGKTHYECTYTDFSGIGDSTGAYSLSLCDFGQFHQRLDHCAFEACGTVFKERPYSWANSLNKDFYVRDCKFTNSIGTAARFTADGTAGVSTTEVVRNSFDKLVDFNAKVHVEDNLFERSANVTGGPLLSRKRNLYRVGNGDPEVLVNCDVFDEYWLANLNHPGNPHCFNSGPAGGTYDGIIFEYPGTFAIDGGELVFTPNGGITVVRCLAIPSETDGFAIGAMATHGLIPTGTGWTVEHNTVVGAATAQMLFTEASSDQGTIYASLKSNLVVDLTGNTALLVQDTFTANTDIVAPADADYNGMFGQDSYADPTSGQTLQGYRTHFTTAPGANDIIADPQFVDPTRNFARWSVYKGAANAGDTLAVRTEASLVLLRADPTLLGSDLIPWVRAGFAPTNAAYNGTAHDGGTPGAVAFSATGSTGTASLSLAAIVLSASGSVADPVFEASAALALPPVAIAAAGTVADPVDTAAAALTLPAVQFSGDAAFAAAIRTASAALALAPVQISATGETDPPVFTATASLTLAPIALVAVGDTTPPPVEASGSLTLAALTLSASGAVEPSVSEGTATLTLPALQLSGTATFVVAPFSPRIIRGGVIEHPTRTGVIARRTRTGIISSNR